MAEGIAEVLKSHQLANYSRERYCLCGTFLGDWADEATTAAHQAEALAAAGYGKLEDAWDEGYDADNESWPHCVVPCGACEQCMEEPTANPYRRPE